MLHWSVRSVTNTFWFYSFQGKTICGQRCEQLIALPSVWILLWHVQLTWALLQTMFILSKEQHSLMAVASFSRIIHPDTKQNGSGFRSTTASLRCQNGLKCYRDGNLIEHQWIVLDKQAGGPTSKGSLKIPEHTFRRLCRSPILGSTQVTNTILARWSKCNGWLV